MNTNSTEIRFQVIWNQIDILCTQDFRLAGEIMNFFDADLLFDDKPFVCESTFGDDFGLRESITFYYW